MFLWLFLAVAGWLVGDHLADRLHNVGERISSSIISEDEGKQASCVFLSFIR